MIKGVEGNSTQHHGLQLVVLGHKEFPMPPPFALLDVMISGAKVPHPITASIGAQKY